MISSTLFSPLGDWIALACQNLGQLIVWEWQSQTYVLKQQGHFNNMTQLAYSPDGMHVASGGDDGKVSSYPCVTSHLVRSPSRSSYGTRRMASASSRSLNIPQRSVDLNSLPTVNLSSRARSTEPFEPSISSDTETFARTPRRHRCSSRAWRWTRPERSSALVVSIRSTSSSGRSRPANS